MLVLTWYRAGLKTCLFYGFFFLNENTSNVPTLNFLLVLSVASIGENIKMAGT